MSQDLTPTHESPFQKIRRVNGAGNEYWSSREFAQILGYTNYRNFEQVIQKARTACFNSGHRIEDHFVGADEMILNGQHRARGQLARMRTDGIETRRVATPLNARDSN